MDKAIIGGTGVYNMAENVESRTVKTKYGEAFLDIASINGQEIVFLARHGKNHSVPPHLINYRANIMALKEFGVKYIYATVAVGSCNKSFNVSDVVLIKDFIDFTKSRVNTFYEGGEEGVIHTDMSSPYCSNLREKFKEEAKKLSLDIKGDAVYVCTEGPRFETASEIKMYSAYGGDVVGMTNVPEVVLAKELGMCYSAIGIVSNMCTGVMGSDMVVHDIVNSIEGKKELVIKTCLEVFNSKINQDNCSCNRSTIRL